MRIHRYLHSFVVNTFTMFLHCWCSFHPPFLHSAGCHQSWKQCWGHLFHNVSAYHSCLLIFGRCWAEDMSLWLFPFTSRVCSPLYVIHNYSVVVLLTCVFTFSTGQQFLYLLVTSQSQKDCSKPAYYTEPLSQWGWRAMHSTTKIWCAVVAYCQ